MDDPREQLRRFIADNFLLGTRPTPLADSDSFLEHQVLDSTGFLELVAFLEETYAIRIGDEEMIPENLDSLDNLVRFLRTKETRPA